MCGILGAFNYQQAPNEVDLRTKMHQLSRKQRHRGPDWSGLSIIDRHNAIAHERLCIMGTKSGSQPIKIGNIILAVNGEIYNYLKLRRELKQPHAFKTGSDCEIILHLFQERGIESVKDLRGIFSFILYDGIDFYAARDPIGINPLYQGFHKDGSVWFASEMKCLISECERIEVFPPGFYYSSKTKQHVRYYEPRWMQPQYVPVHRVDYTKLRESLIEAVEAQMMSEVPYGVLLSGGLDSSLIAAIANKIYRQRFPESPLNTFCIGFEGASDATFAKQVADFLGSDHHQFILSIEEGLDMIEDAIYHLETYDVTTIRASIPMFLLSRHIKAKGIRMVLSGEGSDEIFGGYLYFHDAPDSESFQQETVSRLTNIHYADCLRANKSTMAWGLEIRVPFLDLDFLETAMNISPEDKVCTSEKMEKYILRRAFDEFEAKESFLPHSVLWRQKEQFSDGVGYSWIDTLKAFTSDRVSDERLQNARDIYDVDTPTTKEAFYYRDIFTSYFPGRSAVKTVKRWIPRADWGCSEDPSGRAQKVHCESTTCKTIR